MKAMILAAGEGTRLRPLTLSIPKALLPVCGTPLIVYQLSWLRQHGITEIAVNLHHLGDQIRKYLGDGSRFGATITYSEEPVLLGTAGGVKKACSMLGDTFVVVYGDIITNLDLAGMIRFHHNRSSLLTVALQSVSAAQAQGCGVVEIDNNSRITGFVEKPVRLSARDCLINGGVYVMNRTILDSTALDSTTENKYSDFGYDVIPTLVARKDNVYGYQLGDSDLLLDVGTYNKYKTAGDVLCRYRQTPQDRNPGVLMSYQWDSLRVSERSV